MCGISVLINTQQKQVPQEFLQKMNEKILHRGPDDTGIYTCLNVGFGHTRLSILDLSKAGHQPMLYKDYVITYNGEVYNYIELREELKQKGYSFKSNTDTEVILTAYAEWGTDSFKKLNGMWAFAIYDKNKNEMILCRDHFGIKPLQYCITSEYFAAFSEIKQAFALPFLAPKLNKKTAADFLAFGSLNQSTSTFFEGIYDLPAGHSISYNLNDNTHKIIRWYDITLTPSLLKNDISFNEATKQTYHLLAKSLNLRIRSDVKVGSCLSGGIDSSAIVTTLYNNKLVASDFTTITSSYHDKEYDERYYSEKVTDLTGYKSIITFPDLNTLLENKLLEKINYHQDQPIPSASHFAEYTVFETARANNITVMLDGQGSDEYFGGYGEFIRHRLLELVKELKFSSALNMLKQKAVNQNGALTNELKKLLAHFIVNEENSASSMLTRQFAALTGENALKKNYRNIRELSLAELISTSIPYQLHSEDRNSMLFSVESRLPFLDHDLVEFILSLPSDYKVDGALTKKVLRYAIPGLPEEIKNRKDKMGFVAPDKKWFIENGQALLPRMNKLCKDLDFILSPLLFENYKKDIIERQIYHPKYFRALSFYSWFNTFNINSN